MTQNQVQKQMFCYFFKFSSLVFLEIAQNDCLEHCLDKALEKNFMDPKFSSKLGQGFCHFLTVPSLAFPDIAQDCNMRQCLTASRAETSKHFLCKIGAEMIFSILMLSSELRFLFLWAVTFQNYQQYHSMEETCFCGDSKKALICYLGDFFLLHR